MENHIAFYDRKSSYLISRRKLLQDITSVLVIFSSTKFFVVENANMYRKHLLKYFSGF